jgi:hypothetical protein
MREKKHPREPAREKRAGAEPVLFEEILYRQFVEKYGMTREDFLRLAMHLADKKLPDRNKGFPVSILRSPELSSLEAIVKYLRENRKLGYRQIGSLLNRNPATLAVTYKVAKRKKKEPFSPEADFDTERINFSAFAGNLSVLEAICHHLKSHGKSFSQISHLIDRDQKTVWTVCSRAQAKLKRRNGSTK